MSHESPVLPQLTEDTLTLLSLLEGRSEEPGCSGILLSSPLSCSLKWPYTYIIRDLFFSYVKEKLVPLKIPVYLGLTLSLNPECFPLPEFLCLWQWESNHTLNELDLFLSSRAKRHLTLNLSSVRICLSHSQVPGSKLIEREKSVLRRWLAGRLKHLEPHPNNTNGGGWFNWEIHPIV